jgi:CDP-glycerol glycerophosphotransferase (TagB/SpsB family)
MSYFGKAFRVKDESKLKAFGYPRCDIFFLNKNELNSHIHKYESNLYKIILKLKGFKKTYIYMPTWRDYDFIEEGEFDFFKLNETLEKSNSYFLLKLHPATKVNLSEIKKFNNIKLLANDIDIYPLLPFTDCLITDYSSIYFDYLLLKGKEIKLFPFDKDKYVTEDRGFVDEYDKVMLSSKYYSFNELLKSLSIKEELTCGNRYEKQIKLIWDNFTGNSTEKILHVLNTKSNNTSIAYGK